MDFLELGLVWEGGLDFAYLNDDFAGSSGAIMQTNALNFLSESFANFQEGLNWQEELYQVIINNH